ncbi:hypothetical protein FRUB_10448 [Fimbriiglobus ruber]|uniref:Cytochrome c domain-containing protein n=1 Tax=Fimbriiglobus ruber TaxID=1908690 RepID=A0A225DEC8_9BACT|nr:hypothetical protein FRUB_10448 [Fimbriiglobus ruber]
MASAADPTPGPLPAEKAARGAVLPDGFRMSVVAAEPEVVQPISFCTDARGRLWVAEAMNYGTWKPTGKDRVVILEDRDGDGRAETRKVFYEGFNYITGIEVGFGGVWVVSPPGLYFIPDRDGDDKPDGPPELLFDGFGYKESRHNLVNGFTWGPDGWLYGGHGRTSPSDVGRPGTPAAQRIHCDGGVYRIHPTRLVFENFADGTTNPWGVDFDDFGQCFVSNCVNPHLFHMIQGGHYEPWRNRPSSLYAYDRIPTIADHLHYPSGKPKSMRGETEETLAMGGGHAHCGTLVYLANQFPPAYRNTVLLCNIHGRRINNDVLKPKGSGYTASHDKDLMIAADPWFMGVTLRTGPDGSVLVSDWSDTGECHTLTPHTDNGRIYRISYGNPNRKPVDLTKLSDVELADHQFHPNDWYVRHARLLLQERAAQPNRDLKKVRDALTEILIDSRWVAVPLRLRALWALHVINRLDAKRLCELLGDREEQLRAWAIQLLCETGAPPADALTRFRAMAKSDPSQVVRVRLASALQRLPAEDRWGIAEGLLSHSEDAADASLPLMDWYGIEPLVSANVARALGLAVAAEIPLVRQFIARRVVDAVAAAGPSGDLSPLVAALARSDAKRQLDLLVGIREGIQGRKQMPMPANWPATYKMLNQSADQAIREQAVTFALVLGDPQAAADLRKAAGNASASAADRVAALNSLIEHHVPDLAPTLQAALTDPAIRLTAIRGLAGYPHDATAAKLLALYPRLTADEKSAIVATLAARKDSALALLDAVDRKVIPRADITAFTARQLYAMGDRGLSDRLRQVWGEVRETAGAKKEQLTKFKSWLGPVAMKSADPRDGRLVFSKTCQQCHKLYGEGGAIGPDLTGSNRSDLDYLLSNIIDPSAEVARDYRMSIVTTVDGRVITGIVAERSATRLVIQTATEKIALPAADLESVKDTPTSIMPEGQLDSMTRAQVVDLIAYLSGKTQVPLPSGGK